MKTLIVYYSQAMGNTRRIVNMIKEKIDADITEIDTVEPYTGSYHEITVQGQDEVNAGYKPEIKQLDKNVRDYERIIVATPTWWYTMAPAVLTFLTQTDLSGKDVIFVQTHGGWPGHCIKDMSNLCKDSNIVSSYAVQFDSQGGDTLVTSIEEIEKWIDTL